MKIMGPPSPKPQFPSRPKGDIGPKDRSPRNIICGPYKWEGTFGGKFCTPASDRKSTSLIIRFGWKQLWRRYYGSVDMTNILVEPLDKNIILRATLTGIGVTKSDNIFGRMFKSLRTYFSLNQQEKSDPFF
jgi:hypothetical protein